METTKLLTEASSTLITTAFKFIVLNGTLNCSFIAYLSELQLQNLIVNVMFLIKLSYQFAF